VGAGGASSPVRSSSAPDTAGASVGAFDAPAKADLYLGLVDGLIRQQRYRAALAFLDQYASSGAGATPQFLLLRGEALLGSGDNEGALAAFVRLSGTPYAGEALDGEGRAEGALGQWSAAEKYLNDAVAARPSRADFRNNLAYVKLQSGREHAREAAADLRAARELAPHSDPIRNNLVLALTLSDEKAEADAVLATIVDSRERNAVASFANQWGKPQSAKETKPPATGTDLRLGFDN
jgi:Flp pilus assembly protein TadD